jgi:hypothetical protein
MRQYVRQWVTHASNVTSNAKSNAKRMGCLRSTSSGKITGRA